MSFKPRSVKQGIQMLPVSPSLQGVSDLLGTWFECNISGWLPQLHSAFMLHLLTLTSSWFWSESKQVEYSLDGTRGFSAQPGILGHGTFLSKCGKGISHVTNYWICEQCVSYRSDLAVPLFLLPIHDFRENGSTWITLCPSVSQSVTLLLAR